MVLRLSRLVLLDILSYKPTYEERPELPCAGLSFGNRTNGLSFVARLVCLRKHGSYSGAQSACRTPPPLPLRRPRIELILLGVSLQSLTCPPIK